MSTISALSIFTEPIVVLHHLFLSGVTDDFVFLGTFLACKALFKDFDLKVYT